MNFQKRVLALLLTSVLLLSCFAASFSAFAEGTDPSLQAIANTIDQAQKDQTPEDGAFQTAIELLRNLTPEQLTEVGRCGGANQGEEFWWAGFKTLRLHSRFQNNATAGQVRNYFPSVLLEIAQNVPAYAPFIGVVLDAVISYAYLIGTPTADPAPLSEAQRDPLAIGERIAELPEAQVGSLFSEWYFGSGFVISYEGVTEQLDEEKAKNESIGAIKELIDLFGITTLESWTTVYCSEKSMSRFYLAFRYFQQYYANAEPGLAALSAFADTMNAIQEPYDQADVDAATQAYAAVPVTAWGLKDEKTDAALEKYKAVVSANRLEDNAIDLSAFQETDLGKKYSLGKKNASSALGLLDSLTGVDQALGNGMRSLATGAHLVSLVGKIATAEEMFAPLFSISNIQESLAKDPKFSGAVQKMQSLQQQGHTEGLMEFGTDEEGFRITTWNCADQFTSADFGFEDGDFRGFVDAFSACFGVIDMFLPMMRSFAFKNKLENGVYTVGNYESLLPLLEVLDLDVLSSAQFTAREEAMTFTDAEGNAYSDSVRAALNLILSPLASYLNDTFLLHPLDSLIDLLPKAAYAIETGLLNDTVQVLLGGLSAFGITADLSKDGVWTILDHKLISGEMLTNESKTATRKTNIGFDVNHDGVKDGFPMTKAQYDELITHLAGSAKPVVKKSVAIRSANRLGLETSEEKVVSSLLLEFVVFLKTKEGKAFFDSLINSSSMQTALQALLKTALSLPKDVLFQAFGKYSAVIMIVINCFKMLQTLKELSFLRK